jgi:hypothetical protein
MFARDDEYFFSLVAQELDAGPPSAGLWAMAFARSNGDEAKAKALYLKLRAAQLRREYYEARAREEKELAIRAKQKETQANVRQQTPDTLSSDSLGRDANSTSTALWELGLILAILFVLFLVLAANT